MATKFSKEEIDAMRSMSPEQRKAFVDAKATENKTTTNQDARRDRIAEFKMRQEMLQNIPRGAKSSAPGNPYSVAVADPFGAIAGGVMNYQEMKELNKAKAERGVDAVNAENAAATIGTAMSESAANYEPPADWVNVGKGVMQNTVTGEERVSKAYQSEAEKDRAGKLADAVAEQMATIESERRRAGTASAGIKEKIGGRENQADLAGDIATAVEATPEAYTRSGYAIDLAGDINPTLGQGLEDLIKTPEEKAIRGRASQLVSEIRKDISGTGVSGVEAALGKGWDPTAAKTQAEFQQRMRALEGYQRNKNASVKAQFPTSYPEGGQPFQRPASTQAPIQAAPAVPQQQQQSGPAEGSRMQQGGKNYVYRNGQWQEG